MAWIIPLKLSDRHPKPRFQVVYRDEHGKQRSGGVYPTQEQAATQKARIERGKLPRAQPRRRRPRTTTPPSTPTITRADIVTVGDYVTHRWWEPWKDLHPASASSMRYVLNKRILPAFGDTPLAERDTDAIVAWYRAGNPLVGSPGNPTRRAFEP